MEHYVIKPAGEAGEAAVHAGLRAYNRTFVSDTADLSLVVEDGAGQIIGGCNAFRMGELALLDVLGGGVPPGHRPGGLPPGPAGAGRRPPGCEAPGAEHLWIPGPRLL